MTLSIKTVVAVGISALLLGASIGTADAMPVAPAAVHAATSVETVAYLHRHYPGYYSRSSRKYRHVRRNSINKYCQNQPSRCH